MASIKISSLPAITTTSAADVLIINEDDTSTKKITFENFSQNFAELPNVGTQTFLGLIQVGSTAGDQIILNPSNGLITAAEAILGTNTYPTTQGTNGQVLKTNGSGTLSFENDAAGATTQVMFNDAGVLAGDANFTFNKTSDTLNSGSFIASADVTCVNATASGVVQIGDLRIVEDGVGLNFSQFTQPALTGAAGNKEYSLPTDLPASNGMTLHCTTAGVMTWDTDDVAANPAGADTQVQFNNGGAFGASAGLTFNGTALSASGLSVTGNSVFGDANTDTLTFTARIADSTNLEPLSTNSVNLGAQALRFNNGFFNNCNVTTLTNNAAMTISTSSGIITLSPTGPSVTTAKTILPNADGTLDLGATGTRWANVWMDAGNVTNNFGIGGNLDVDGNTTVDGLESQGDVTIDGLLRLEETGAGNNFITFAAAATMAATNAYVWPAAFPAAASGMTLHCTNAGVMTWEADDVVLGALLGVANDAADLGTFTGSTIADSSSVKTALQALETELETKASAAGLAASLHLDDVRTALGIAEQSTTFGTFSGATLQDNDTLPDLLQALETATELRATSDAPSFTGVAAFAGDVNFNSGGMFFKQSTSRLGLGTTAPEGGLHIKHGSVNAMFQRDGGSSKLVIKPNATDDGMTIQGQSNSGNCIILDTVGGSAAVKITNNDHGTLASIGSSIELNKSTAITGDLDVSGNVQIDNDGGYYLHFDRNTSTQLDIATGNIPSGGNLNIKNSNGTDAKVVVYSDLFWCRGLGGSNGNGTAKFDGNVEMGSELRFSNNYANKAAAGTGALGDVAVIGGKLCFHDGSDWKEITLGSAPA